MTSHYSSLVTILYILLYVFVCICRYYHNKTRYINIYALALSYIESIYDSPVSYQLPFISIIKEFIDQIYW